MIEETIGIDLSVINKYNGVIILIMAISMITIAVIFLLQYNAEAQRTLADPCSACERYNYMKCINWSGS